MKNLRLIMRTIITMFKSNAFFSAWLVIIQILVSFSAVFLFATVPSATANSVAAYRSVRTVTFDFGTPTDEYTYESLNGIMSNSKIAVPELLTFTFASEDGTYFTAYSVPASAVSDITEGRGISDQDNAENKYVVVVCDYIIDEEKGMISTETKIGDTVELGGKAFEVIGYKKFPVYSEKEIPFVIGFSDFYLTSVSALLPANLSDREIAVYRDEVSESLIGASAQELNTISQAVFGKIAAILIICVFLSLISLINICFIYRFILKRMKPYFGTLRIVGEKGKRIIGHIYSVYISLFSMAYILSIGIFYAVKGFGNLTVFSYADSHLLGIIAAYVIFVLLISLLLVKTVINVYKPIKEAGMF